jgi:hypothetical protein
MSDCLNRTGSHEGDDGKILALNDSDSYPFMDAGSTYDRGCPEQEDRSSSTRADRTGVANL